MAEEFHVRLSENDAALVKKLVKQRVFATVSEAIRFGVKQVLQMRLFASVVEPELSPSDKVALRAPLQLGNPSHAVAAPAPALGPVPESPELKEAEIREALVTIWALRTRIEEAEALAVRATGALTKSATVLEHLSAE